MKKIYLGNTKEGDEVVLDFEKEKIRFILLVGSSGSGKSVFHKNLYKQLLAEYSSNEIGFVFFDMTMVDFNDWQSDYLIEPVINNPQEALMVLQELANLPEDKKIFIHIEECDMVYEDRKAIETAFEKIKGRDNIYVVYSTSRIDREYLSDWMNRFIDLKVVFRVPTESDSEFLIGKDTANHFASKGERALFFNDRLVICQPFNAKETESLIDFKL